MTYRAALLGFVLGFVLPVGIWAYRWEMKP